jgi:prefoldin subunit 5
MGALFVTSMSVFTSCKDYDDDINSNTQLISTLQSQFDEQKKSIDALKAQLTSDFNTATSAADAAKAAATQALAEAQKAQTAADAAATKAAAAQTAADAAKATGDEALAKAKQAEADAATAEANAQKGIADAKTAQATADAAKAAAAEAAAAAAAAKIEVLEQLNAQVAQLQAAIDGKVSKEEFDKIIATLATTDGLNAALATVNAEIAKLQEQLNATNAALNAHETDVENKVNEAKDNIASVGATVKAIQDKLDELYNDAVRKGDFDQAIALLTARLEGVEKNLATFKNYDDTAIRELISANADAIANNSTAISNNTTAIAANAASIAALQQTVLQIAVNTAAIEALDARVGNLEQAVQQIENLATKEALQEALVALNAAIATKANQEDVEEAIASLTAALGVVAAATDDKFADIEAVLAAVIADVEAIKAGASTSDELDQVKADIAALEAYVATLASKTDLDALQAAFEVTLEAKLANLNDNLLAVINNKVDGLLAQIDAISGISGEVQTLSGKVTDNATAIANLQTTMQVVNQLIDGLGSRISVLEGKTGQYDAYDGRISILEGKVATYDAYNGRIQTIEGELAGLNAALAEVNTILAGLEDLSGSRMSSLGANAASSASTLANVLKSMANEIKALNSAVATLQEQIDQITLLVSKNLTSLVYRPEGDNAYLYGFPTIKATLLTPQDVYGFAYTKSTDKDVVSVSGKNVSKQFDIIAKYWLNPSNTDITKYKFGFDEVAAKNQITRGNQDNLKAGITANPIKVDNKGILWVALKIANATNVNDAKTIYLDKNDKEYGTDFVRKGSSYAWLTTVALQAVRNDANNATVKDTVTSDYAVIVPDYCSDLLLANAAYSSKAHDEGNQLFHLRTVYDELKAENSTGSYSYELEYNTNKVVDLTTIDIHYNGDAAVMKHADAEARGFSFKYTILKDADYFTLDNEKQTIAIKDDKKAISSVGKVANVRVELQADGKTFAYGYVSIIITNIKKDVLVEMGKITLQCPGDFKVKMGWSTLENKIKEVVGPSFNFNNYTVDLSVALAKVDANGNAIPASQPISASVLKKDGSNLVWSFSEATAKKLFYNGNDAKDENAQYIVYVKLTPKDGKPEVAEVTLKVVINGVVYPRGTFYKTQRIARYWFIKETDDIAQSEEERHEVHANVDVYGQTGASDHFKFDVSSWFYQNNFWFEPATGFNWEATINNEAPMFFDASKYNVRGAAANGAAITEPKEVLTGASGAKYVLYLDTQFALELKAAKADASGNFKYSDADDQVVVVLTSDDPITAPHMINRNNWAEFQGYKWIEGMTPRFDYAQDLLNNASHSELKAGQTFTSHMVFADYDVTRDENLTCLPIDFQGDKQFDIRYLRPLSASKRLPKIIIDAIDGGTDNTKIWLTQIASFTDWRKVAFTAETAQGMRYLYYYGVKKIEADFDNARTNLNGGANLAYTAPTGSQKTGTVREMTTAEMNEAMNWPLISDVTNKLKFTPDAAAQTPATSLSPTQDSNEFKTVNCGYYLYENNAGNVGTFQIYLPISIVYDWGKTKPEYVLITIERTTGQEITGESSRQQ